MMELPVDLPAELVPLTWVIGTWEGLGMVEYKVGDELREHAFRQRVEFRHNGGPFLEYHSQVWLLGEPQGPSETEGDDAEPAAVPTLEETPLTSESGFWRLARSRTDGDVGPGMLPPSAAPSVNNVDDVEALRNSDNGFDLEVTLAHPTGVSEVYYGMVRGPRIDLATDGVLRTAGARDYRSATRIYGLVNNRMFWAWDIAALDQELATHASAQLDRV
ncbi:FABP family protein [Gulosibacter bifidus]|uniref:Peroxynitrite isomerase n=1 Tax=Gulosibacter bifidus TaxID=272239 RepID=A0ABW5RH67_9MICO|nr:FABP family protein [Gulosibacter bifidus]